MKTPIFIINALNNYFRFVVGGAVVVVLIFGYIILLSPKVNTVQTSQVTAQKSAEADLKTKQDQAASLRESNAKFQAEFTADRLRTINEFLPDAPDFPRLLLLVKNLVAQSQLTLNNFSLTSAKTGNAVTAESPTSPASPIASDVQSADMAISVSGGSTYESFKNLLANLESSQPLLDVVSLTFAAAPPVVGGVQSAIPSVVWTFTLRTYYLPKL